jgi:hypothetical protein
MNYNEDDLLKLYRKIRWGEIDPEYQELLCFKKILYIMVDKVFILDDYNIKLFMKKTIELLYKLKEDNKLDYLNSTSISFAFSFLHFNDAYKLPDLLEFFIYTKEFLNKNKESYYNKMNELIDEMHMRTNKDNIDIIKNTFFLPLVNIIEIEQDSW